MKFTKSMLAVMLASVAMSYCDGERKMLCLRLF